jgi:hypothetical protein
MPDKDKPAVYKPPPLWWEVRRELRSWTPADKRTLWITVVGGMIVNVATLVIIALGIALIRWQLSLTVRANEIYLLVLGTIEVTTFLLILFGVRGMRSARFIISLAMTVGSLAMFMLLLGLVGASVGIK